MEGLVLLSRVLILVAAVTLCGAVVIKEPAEEPKNTLLWSVPEDRHTRVQRDAINPEDRLNCSGETQPPNRVDTTERVLNLRASMDKYGLDAYLVPSEDAHQSEYVALPDERRKYISGFSGSAGIAVILKDKQALWTDGRYFLQADEELDCNWLLMRERLEGTPSVTEWLKSNLESNTKVGADPRLFGASTWTSYQNSLSGDGISMVTDDDVNSPENLVDEIWTDRPSYSTEPAFVHAIEYAGETWEDKIVRVENAMTEEQVEMLVITALDEVAWLLNLRGDDIPYNPVFRGYVIIDANNVFLFTPDEKVSSAEVRGHLKIDGCTGGHGCVQHLKYDEVIEALQTLSADATINKVLLPGGLALGASYAIFDAVPEAKRHTASTPTLTMKANKNDIEISGMKNAHIKDAVGLIRFLHFLQTEIEAGNDWNELSVVPKMEEFRSSQDKYRGLSFETISAYGANGAIIHYSPSEATSIKISNDSLYLLDSGGQYDDGTTDVTRTMHFGSPTDFQIEMYTRVLMGNIDFATLVFPQGTTNADIDIVARRPIYEVGLDYRHGTGHGVGMFLNVHETNKPAYEPGYFTSNEPGYYEDGDFGIRIETVMVVQESDTPYEFDYPYYEFETINLVPFEPKLINSKMLNQKQCEFLNTFNKNIRNDVGNEILSQGHDEAYAWLLTKTEPYTCPHFISGSSNLVPTTAILFASLVFLVNLL